jgi:hypothetical protein
MQVLDSLGRMLLLATVLDQLPARVSTWYQDIVDRQPADIIHSLSLDPDIRTQCMVVEGSSYHR